MGFQAKNLLQSFLLYVKTCFVAKRKRNHDNVFVGNPAFGGRGSGVHRKSKRKKVCNKCFDSTLGYPGEGWATLRIATWNTRSLSFERFEYCKQLNYDVLAITEMWRRQRHFQTKSKNFTVSSPIIMKKGPNKGQPCFPNDKEAGVGILLSKRMQSKLMAFGSQGERVCWVRLQGPTCNIFILAVYMPHRGRINPSQSDTISDIERVLSKVPRGDCICILGDLNEHNCKQMLNTGQVNILPALNLQILAS